MGKKYKLVTVHDKSKQIYSTHPEVIKWLFAEVKRRIPSARRFRQSKSDVEYYHLKMDKLDNKDTLVMYWIRQYLCDNGWEPLDLGTYRKTEEIEA